MPNSPRIALIGFAFLSLAFTPMTHAESTAGQGPAAGMPQQSSEGWQGVALGVKLGTLGPGADLTVDVLPRLNLRINANYLRYNYDRTIDDVDYEIDLDFVSFMALIDWHPFANNFRISGGAIRNNSETTLSGTPNESVTIGDHEYPAVLIGTLSGKLTFDELAPYVGIGFGNAVSPATSVSFIFDLGVIFQTLDVELSADGPAQILPQFQSDLRKEEANIQDDLDGLKIYPVLSFGIAYHF